MKTFIISICLVAGSLVTATAQDKCLRQFRESYRGKAEVHSVRVGALPLRFAGWVMSFDSDDKDAKAVKLMLKGVKKVKVYSIENFNGATVTGEDITRLKNDLQRKDNFEPLMEVRDKGSMIHVLNKGKDDELGNVVMLVQDDNEFLMVNLQTNLKITDINSLIRQFASN